MDWLDKMNAAMDYIEDNLNQEIDNNIIAQKACCSVYNFQRMFSFITDVTLAEYIRRRRLTQAAFEIQHGNKTITELSLIYGYESPVSFARAFFNLHGVNPSEAKKPGIKLKSYPKLSFKLSIKGVEDLNYRIEKMGKMRFVGINETITFGEQYDQIPKIWDRVCLDHMIETISQCSMKECPVVFGICHSFEEKKFQYMIGVESEKELPEGFVELQVPELLWVKFECYGPLPDSIQNVWKRMYTEWFQTSGYEMDDGPQMECYFNTEMQYPNNDKNEIWIPIRPCQ